MNDDARGTYNTNSQIRFKISMLKSSLCDYGGAYILVSGTISLADTSVADVAANNFYKKVIFKNCAPFNDCISEINNTQVHNAKDTEVVMSIYNLIEYSDSYSKKLGCLWQYYRDETSLDNNDNIADFTDANHNSISFKYKQKITGQTDDGSPLINCENNIILTCSQKCVIASNTAANKATTCAIADTKIYVSVVTLSTQDNAKLLKLLKSDFKRTINWNKYQ